MSMIGIDSPLCSLLSCRLGSDFLSPRHPPPLSCAGHCFNACISSSCIPHIPGQCVPCIHSRCQPTYQYRSPGEHPTVIMITRTRTRIRTRIRTRMITTRARVATLGMVLPALAAFLQMTDVCPQEIAKIPLLCP